MSGNAGSETCCHYSGASSTAPLLRHEDAPPRIRRGNVARTGCYNVSNKARN